MTPREIVREQIRHRETRPIPYSLAFEPEVGARISEHFGGDAWRGRLTPYIASCAAIDRRKREPLDEGRMRDRFGSVWRTDRRPFHLETPALPAPSLDGYPFPDADAFVEPDLEQTALRNLERLADSFTTINVGWGLWELYWGIRGFENAMTDCAAEPGFFADLLDRLTDLFLEQLERCRNIPADAFFFGDDWGDQRGVMIGPDRWRKFFKPRYAKIYSAARGQGKTVISHSCGSVADILPDLIDIGLDVLESVQPEARGMRPEDLKREWGGEIAFWGCLGSQSVIPFGSPGEIRAEVRRLCRVMGPGGGFILAPAKPLQPETPTPNAVAIVEAFLETEADR